MALAYFCTTLCGQVTLKAEQDDRISISVDGALFTNLYLAKTNAKPFLAPLRSATGALVTRRFPMELVEGESRDHPHHRGLWIGYGSINDINFWENDPDSKISPENPQKKGRVQLVRVLHLESGKKSGTVAVLLDWVAPSGTRLIQERRTFTFSGNAANRQIDCEAKLTALQNLTFADTKEGFFAVRVADSMTGKNGGVLTNSEGASTEKDVWGHHASWVDYDGAAEGQKVGIVIMDNPRNPNHPPRWHARDYGLFAVNPFGEKEFDPKSSAGGGFKLPAGESAVFRYRVIIHPGDTSKKVIAAWYSKFAGTAK